MNGSVLMPTIYGERLFGNTNSNRYINIEFSKDTFKVPLMGLSTLEYLFRIKRLLDNKDIIIPVSNYNSDMISKLTERNLINGLSSIRSRLLPFIYRNKEIIYTNKGIIVNDNFDILFCCYCTFQKKLVSEDRVELDLIKYEVFINNLLFERFSPVDKFIIQKLLPYITEDNIRPYCTQIYNNFRIFVPTDMGFDISVKSNKDMQFIKPNKITTYEDMKSLNSDLNQVLINYLNSIKYEEQKI
jgi:hypothetical protein